MFQGLLSWLRQPKPPGGATPRQLAEYNTSDARDLFSHLLRRVRSGEEIVVCHAGWPVAKLVPYSGEPRRPGLLRTQVVVEEVTVLDPLRQFSAVVTPTRSSRAASTSRRARRG